MHQGETYGLAVWPGARSFDERRGGMAVFRRDEVDEIFTGNGMHRYAECATPARACQPQYAIGRQIGYEQRGGRQESVLSGRTELHCIERYRQHDRDSRHRARKRLSGGVPSILI